MLSHQKFWSWHGPAEVSHLQKEGWAFVPHVDQSEEVGV